MNSKIGWIIILLIVVIALYFGFSSEKEVVVENVDVSEETSVFTASDLNGVWVSTEDSNFTREFEEGGVVTDKYEGVDDATSVGSWTVVDDVSEESVELPSVEEDQLVLRLVFDTETLYFAVTPDSTPSELSMTYLNGNGVLSFVREE